MSGITGEEFTVRRPPARTQNVVSSASLTAPVAVVVDRAVSLLRSPLLL